MSITYIARTTETFKNVVNAATAVGTNAFSINTAVGAVLRCTSTSTGAALVVKFHVSDGPGTTTYELRDATDTAVSITVSPLCAYELPSELFAAPYVTITTASGTASFLVSTKS